MATPGQLAYFNSARVTNVMNAQTDPRLQPQPLIWNQRIPDVPSWDEEITAKYRGSLLIADLIMDDAKAAVYSQGKFQFESQPVPNIKMGLAMNQAMLNALQRIKATGGAMNDDANVFTDRYAANIAAVKYGVELRKEVLKIAMVLDGFNYDRLGIKMNNGTFGMYSDLKVFDSDWTNVGTTGLSTLITTRQLAKNRYMVNLDRATMSTPALRALVKQTEFTTQVKNVNVAFSLGSSAPIVPLQSDSLLKRLVEQIITGVGEPFTIEINDERYESQDNTGTISQNRKWPINKVALTSAANDGNAKAWDFANCVVTESIVGSMVPNSIIGAIPIQRGPLAYVTAADQNLNSPGIITWGVARGAPRKHQDQASAVIDVGPSLSETFSTSIPNPL